jgi:hypothetical protein
MRLWYAMQAPCHEALHCLEADHVSMSKLVALMCTSAIRMGDELDGSATRLQRVMTRARRDVTPQHMLTADFCLVSTAP